MAGRFRGVCRGELVSGGDVRWKAGDEGAEIGPFGLRTTDPLRATGQLASRAGVLRGLAGRLPFGLSPLAPASSRLAALGSNLIVACRRFDFGPCNVGVGSGFCGSARNGVPGRSRTCDLPLRRRLLYPAELPGRARQSLAESLRFRAEAWRPDQTVAHRASRPSSRVIHRAPVWSVRACWRSGPDRSGATRPAHVPRPGPA